MILIYWRNGFYYRMFLIKLKGGLKNEMICENCGVKIKEFKDYFKNEDNLSFCNEKCNLDYALKEMKSFNNFEELQKFIRKNGFKDAFKIKNVVYTQQEYDIEGKQITYGNKRLIKGFIVNTEDRYNKGTQDAEIEFLEDWYLRNDISYLD